MARLTAFPERERWTGNQRDRQRVRETETERDKTDRQTDR